MPKKADRRPKTNTEKTVRSKRVCLFCTEGKTPSYTDIISLRKFLSSRGKIVPKLRSGVCSRHQRALTREVKHARHLALLPFTLAI